MAIKKHAVPGVAQGYPADGVILGVDIETLKQLYADKDDDVEKTILGMACSVVKNEVETKLKALKTKLWRVCPPETTEGDVVLHMGPLKKVARIMQKAVHYAVCDGNLNEIQLPQVRDVLRATFEFPHSVWETENIGSKLIDTIDKAFNYKVVQVKNRFIETRYPNLPPWDDRKLSDSLKTDIQALFEQNLKGRDTFYRDLQLLVRIDDSDFPNTTGLTHTILEIQLVSRALYGAKVTGSDDEMTGHQKYKLIRTVMEHCEYSYVKAKEGTINLPKAGTFYPDPAAEHWVNFAYALKSMYDLYRKTLQSQKLNHLQKAIDNSDWYKRVTGS